ncbi:hypothetical protein UA08_08853 [Talaromyces atroroseus]|uniref:ACB domain-containing protein n=1 Tax=Talaromyces atroroseus TaxID=1441469 RepID=A0A225AQR6_TALAT|nr:hypothetical protein UA08_08853 [Talaromyces atroroseus]OKL55797.1 hypothetical protein UA08_08853 [Talaromyces atroroseus]
MSDSVDRVFVHALNTVKKIPRTGTARPPAAERLKLYGLYKQSMEGDVEGIMDRPIGDAPDVRAEREKWDSWYSQRGCSRTEAKGRYITTLINTMHMYASQTAEARELVAELEFVWDQIKDNNDNNAPSSSSSSPSSPVAPVVPVPAQRRYGSINERITRLSPNEDPDEDLAIYRRRSGDSRLRVLSPVSQSEEADVVPVPEEGVEENDVDDDDDDDGEEEFQEARDGTSFSEETTTSQDHTNRNNYNNKKRRKRKRPPTSREKDDEDKNNDWRRRVEQALTKMTAEVAALREQIESRPMTIHGRRRVGLWSWLKWLVWNAFRQMLWQCFILSAILIWMRFKGDRRLEQKLRMILVNFKNRLLMTVRMMPRRLPSLSHISLP